VNTCLRHARHAVGNGSAIIGLDELDNLDDPLRVGCVHAAVT
jgi:hypothetical protein